LGHQNLAVQDVEAERLKIPVLESTLALEKHIKRLGLVCLDGSDSLFKHRFRLVGGAEFSLSKHTASDQNACERSYYEFAKHGFLHGRMSSSMSLSVTLPRRPLSVPRGCFGSHSGLRAGRDTEHLHLRIGSERQRAFDLQRIPEIRHQSY
jgi:hypothetical protein